MNLDYIPSVLITKPIPSHLSPTCLFAVHSELYRKPPLRSKSERIPFCLLSFPALCHRFAANDTLIKIRLTCFYLFIFCFIYDQDFRWLFQLFWMFTANSLTMHFWKNFPHYLKYNKILLQPSEKVTM